MYRARVQAVSGSKVFADGKWLRCIGNKPVSVGERVWTDGRVVYGHYTIPQTPLISIPQQQAETVIPIVTTKNFYVFSKGKLKIVTPTGIEGPTVSKIFICNKRAQAYYVNGYSFNPRGWVYHETDNWGFNFKSEEDWAGKSILAANIDKGGNLFGIFWEDENLLIKKNKQTVKEFNLKNLAQEVFDAVAQPSHYPLYSGILWNHSGEIDICIYHSFIESENNFAVFICFDASKTTTRDYDGHEDTNYGSRLYYISNNGIDAQNRDFFSYLDYNPDKKNPLHGGFYFKREPYKRQTSESTFSPYEKITMYAPNDSAIFTCLFRPYPKIIFSEVKGGYLMAVNVLSDRPHDLDGNLQIIQGFPCFYNGIFFFSSGKWTMLTEDFTSEVCLNQSLIPIKNKKNWPNRIKTISFED